MNNMTDQTDQNLSHAKPLPHKVRRQKDSLGYPAQGFRVCFPVAFTLATRPKSKSFHQNNTKCERDTSFQRVIDGACALLCDALPGPSRRFCRGWQVRKMTCWYRGPSWGRMQAQTGNTSDLLKSLPDSKSTTCWKFQRCVAAKDRPTKSSRWL